MGCVAAISSRKADVDQKTLDKAGAIWMLVDLWPLQDLEAGAIVLFASGSTSLGSSRANVLSTVHLHLVTANSQLSLFLIFVQTRHRFDTVGGFPRFVFGSPALFAKRAEFQAAIREPSKLFSDMKSVNLFSCSEYSKYFFSPFLRPGVTSPRIAKPIEPAAESKDSDPAPLSSVAEPSWQFVWNTSHLMQQALDLLDRLPAATIPESLYSLFQFGLAWQVNSKLVQCLLRSFCT